MSCCNLKPMGRWFFGLSESSILYVEPFSKNAPNHAGRGVFVICFLNLFLVLFPAE